MLSCILKTVIFGICSCDDLHETSPSRHFDLRYRTFSSTFKAVIVAKLGSQFPSIAGSLESAYSLN